MGYAVVRSEAARQASTVGAMAPAMSWRKTAGDFVEVGGVWLPRKVELRTVERAQGEESSARELSAAIEDYRVVADPPADLFRPDFAIAALDEATGDFTAVPPPVPAGLADRLAKAVAESPYGPARRREVPRVAARSAPTADRVPDQVQAAQDRLDQAKRLARSEADPAVRSAARRLEALRAEAAQAEVPELAEIQRARTTAEVAAAEARRDLARANSDRLASYAKRVPAVVSKEEAERAELELKAAEADLDARTAEADQSDPLRSRVDARAAEVRRAAAQKALALSVVARNQALRKKGPQYVSAEEAEKAEAELKLNDARLAASKADLDEARLLLDRSKVGAGEAPGDPRPARRGAGTLADLRDEVELMEVQIQGKQAEVRQAESRLEFADRNAARRKQLADAHAISSTEMDQAAEALRAAQAEAERGRAGLLEAEVRLKQARRRAEAEEARLRRAVERAKADLTRAENNVRRGLIAAPELEAARERFDELMFQLDPKYAPGPRTPAGPEAPALRR